jgi:hypothetical protein
MSRFPFEPGVRRTMAFPPNLLISFYGTGGWSWGVGERLSVRLAFCIQRVMEIQEN